MDSIRLAGPERPWPFHPLVQAAPVRAAPFGRPIVILNREECRRKVLGCWMGKNIGGTLARPSNGSAR